MRGICRGGWAVAVSGATRRPRAKVTLRPMGCNRMGPSFFPPGVWIARGRLVSSLVQPNNSLSGLFQIPSDLVVKSQVTDIIGLILQLIRHQNGVHRSCRNRTSRGAVLSTSEVQWA